jgi:F-type H+-transporting ATPase subunit delta
MFLSSRWALAFIKAAADSGAGESGLSALKILSQRIHKIRGMVSGTAAATQVLRFIRQAEQKSGVPEDAALKTASCFIALLIERKKFTRVGEIIGEIEKITDDRNGVVSVTIEEAARGSESGEKEFAGKLEAALKKNSRVAEIKVAVKTNPDLIGGYRLRVGDEVIDASIKRQLQIMAETLANGE